MNNHNMDIVMVNPNLPLKENFAPQDSVWSTRNVDVEHMRMIEIWFTVVSHLDPSRNSTWTYAESYLAAEFRMLVDSLQRMGKVRFLTLIHDNGTPWQ